MRQGTAHTKVGPFVGPLPVKGYQMPGRFAALDGCVVRGAEPMITPNL